MDSFARGLKNAARMQREGIVDKALQTRYSSYTSGIGEKISKGNTSLEELEVLSVIISAWGISYSIAMTSQTLQ